MTAKQVKPALPLIDCHTALGFLAGHHDCRSRQRQVTAKKTKARLAKPQVLTLNLQAD